MPNWCDNSLMIKGNKESIAKITELLKSIEGKETGMFQTLVGIDDSGEGHMKDKLQLNKNGWGTKWDVYGNQIEPSYDDVLICIYGFQTAWSPPVGFCQMLSKQYGVKCELQYEEPGNDFCGKTIVEDGEIVDEDDYDYREGKYKFDNEGFWYEIDSDIDCYVNDFETGEEFFEGTYKDDDYLDEDDKNEIIKMFNNTKSNNE